MLTSKHIYLLTSSLFFIGACVCITSSYNEAELLLIIGLIMSGLFLLLSVPWTRIKTFLDMEEYSGQNCPNCKAELTTKDIDSNICYKCGKVINGD